MKDWIDLAPALRLSLSREDEELIEFHVEDFEEAATSIENAGINVERKKKHHGRITDPFGITIELHDHRIPLRSNKTEPSLTLSEAFQSSLFSR